LLDDALCIISHNIRHLPHVYMYTYMQAGIGHIDEEPPPTEEEKKVPCVCLGFFIPNLSVIAGGPRL
jgi:hypothetical protein